MRLSVMIFGLVCVCALVIGTAAPLVQDDEDVRGAFLTSRPKDKPPASSSTAPKTGGRRKPKPPDGGGSTVPGGGSTKPDKTPKPSKPKPTPQPSTPPTPVNARRLGLGVTLFMRDSNGLAVRVDPEHVFRKGDRVKHPKYGEGMVYQREGDGEDAKITVQFNRFGLKKLVEKYAQLEKA